MATTSPFSVRLAPKLKERLQAEAKRADAGHLIPGDAVHAWIESWGTDYELPMPAVEKAKRRTRA